MSLVEIIVAIGISVITLTSAVVFSSALTKRSQENYMEISAIQLQGLVAEQLRLLESGLKKDIKNGLKPNDSPANPNSYLDSSTWRKICSYNSTPEYYTLSFPGFPSTNAKINIRQDQSGMVQKVAPDQDSGSGTINAYYYKLQGPKSFGSFKLDSNPVFVSIGKTSNYDRSNAINNYVTFKIIVNYKVLGSTEYFTKTEEVKMIYSLICGEN